MQPVTLLTMTGYTQTPQKLTLIQEWLMQPLEEQALNHQINSAEDNPAMQAACHLHATSVRAALGVRLSRQSVECCSVDRTAGSAKLLLLTSMDCVSLRVTTRSCCTLSTCR